MEPSSVRERWLELALLFLVVLVVGRIHGAKAQLLRRDYYELTCPRVESILRGAVSPLLAADPTAPAALLRAAFHDCQVGGCDASLLLNSGGEVVSEQESDKNFGVRRLDILDAAKMALEVLCPGVVSCADIVVLTAREAVRIAGGPNIDVFLGRKDARMASNINADAALPPATITVEQMLGMFQAKGMNTEESVAILGAHTIGVSHCVSFVNRLYPNRDTTLGLLYALRLGVSCPTANPPLINNLTVVANDNTNLIFDNQYFRDVQSGMGLLTIDSELGVHPATLPAVNLFAQNQAAFFEAFASAFNKLTTHHVLVGDQGEVRRSCRAVN